MANSFVACQKMAHTKWLLLVSLVSNLPYNTWGFVPNVTTVGLVVDAHDTVQIAVLQHTVEGINKNPSLLPNTKLQGINVSLTTDSALANIIQLMQADTVALFEATPPQIPSEIAANVLNSTTTTLGRYNCDTLYQVEDYSMCENLIELHQSLITINLAIVGILSSLNVSKVIVVYDVLRSKQVNDFLDRSKQMLTKYELIYLNFGKDSELNSHSLQDLRNLRGLKINTVILFVEPGNTELIMDIVNLYCACTTIADSILWILPRVNSTEYNANPLDKVVALRLYQDRGATYREVLEYVRHSTEYTGYDLPESSALLYDAISLAANAIHDVITRGQWVSSNSTATTPTGLFPNRTKNAGRVRNAMSKVKIKGLTGELAIDASGKRNYTKLEVVNLRKDRFEKIGTYTTTNGMEITGTVALNRPLPTTQIAHKTLRVVAMEQKPFVLISDKGNNTYEYNGYSYDLLMRLSQLLKFNFKIYQAKSNNVSSLIQELHEEKADIALNPIVVSASRQKLISFTKPFMHFSVGLLVKMKTEKDLDLTQFMLPFTIPAWCLLLSSCLVVTVIVYLLDKYSPYGWRQIQQAQGEEGDEFSLFNSLWFCMACMLTQGADNTPRNLSGRILAGCFWFCVLIWNATYTANLASFLVLKNNQLPVTSLDNAMLKGYDVILLKDSAISKVIEISTNSVHRKVWEQVNKRGTFVNSHEKAVQMTRDGEVKAFIAEEPFLTYFKGRKPCNLDMVKNVLQPMSFAFGLPLSSKYTHTMSLGILRLQEQGVTDSFERKWWEYQNQCPKEIQSVSQSRLDVKEMLGVYLVLSAGIVISVIVVGIEIWWRRSLGKTVKTFIDNKKRSISTKVGASNTAKSTDRNENQLGSSINF